MAKNKVEVIIGGSIYSLQGEESNQHIQQVAGMIDEKVIEIQKKYGTKRLSTSQLFMLSAINIADEYLKTKEEVDIAKEEVATTKEELNIYIRELEKCNSENLALLERIEEMGLEINRLKTSIKTK